MKVTLRNKKLFSGNYSITLIYTIRAKEDINIWGYTHQRINQNKTLQTLAEQIRNKTELELQSKNYNVIPEFKRRTSLISYINQKAEKNGKWNKYYSTLKHLRDFTKKDITFQEVDEIWLEQF